MGFLVYAGVVLSLSTIRPPDYYDKHLCLMNQWGYVWCLMGLRSVHVAASCYSAPEPYWPGVVGYLTLGAALLCVSRRNLGRDTVIRRTIAIRDSRGTARPPCA